MCVVDVVKAIKELQQRMGSSMHSNPLTRRDESGKSPGKSSSRGTSDGRKHLIWIK